MKLKIFFWLFVLAWLWGPTFLFTKVAVQEIPPLTLVATRLSLAAVTLYVLLRVQGFNLPKWGKIWRHFFITGLFNNALPYLLLSWGLQYIDSAVSAILIGTTPFFTMLIAHRFTDTEHLSPVKIVGVGLGFVGLVTLLTPALLAGVQAHLWGLVAGLVAAASYGGTIVYTRQYLRGLPSLVGPTAQLTAASILMLPVSIVVERPHLMALPSWPAIGSALMLTFLGTALAFVIYYRLMEFATATTLSMVTYLIPIVATLLGVVILREQLSWPVYVGFALILLGMMAVNRVFSFIGWPRPLQAGVRA